MKYRPSGNLIHEVALPWYCMTQVSQYIKYSPVKLRRPRLMKVTTGHLSDRKKARFCPAFLIFKKSPVRWKSQHFKIWLQKSQIGNHALWWWTGALQRWAWTGSGLDVLQDTCDFLDQDWIWIFIFEKNWIRTGSEYLFNFYKEIFLRVIQDVTNDGTVVFSAVIFIFTKNQNDFVSMCCTHHSRW